MTTSVHSPSPVALPPPCSTPLPTDKAPLKRLLQRHEILSDTDVLYLVKSRSRIDVGSWIRDRRIRVAATPTHLLLFSGGKRPLAERLAYSELYDSVYNHVTGALILAPHIDSRFCTLRISPVDGYQLLAQIYNQDS
jgi:hypothetical protein